ncbi:patatin-like phospholipase family protein [Pseudonocardia spinosispora]|uniref:patatin-like phospholipase family protein n=1 Tax=Pseudonocardia spinosispora TaxID=103441 RepID=UPI00040AE4E3|nr:patatin-like phospholipase family protein [Pseudonocardia spinosispora]
MSRQIGLVLGAGGFLGAAWMLGTLSALQEATDWDARDADLVVGTSAGSVLGALLRAGHSVEDLYRAQQDDSNPESIGRMPAEPIPALAFDLGDEPGYPALPHLGLGSLPLVLRAVREPKRLTPAAVCAGILPRGRRPLTRIGGIVERAHLGDRWPSGTWIVAMDYQTGSRVSFGSADGPRTTIASAVMASCAVPAWYSPVTIGDVPYIDGAVCSPCNADLLVGQGLDEVYVLAPMASLRPDRPTSLVARMERLYRRSATKRVMREVAKLRASGTSVTVLAPNRGELEAMGANMMDSARRLDVLRASKEDAIRRFATRKARRLASLACPRVASSLPPGLSSAT